MNETTPSIATDTTPPTAIIDRIVRPFEVFAHDKVAGAILLMAATVCALIWANSPWSGFRTELLQTHAQVGIGTFSINKPILLWINDGLMAIFFFVVGLEIKREVLAGELASLRKAALPIAGAIGGMVFPALAYVSLNIGGDGLHGWGVPMATDIAFALGVLLLIGPRVPLALKVFLTALAIVDDLGAIVVIACFYTEHIAIGSLMAGGVCLIVSMISNAIGVRNSIFYFLIGTLVWIAFLKSGVHATLAAVLMAMTIPARTRIDGAPLVKRVGDLLNGLRQSALPRGNRMLTSEQQHALLEMRKTVEDGTAPLQDLEHALLPIVTFLVMPIFALANAGVTFGAGIFGAMANPICLGIIVGLLSGKPLGITGTCWLAVKLGFADLPSGVTWRQLFGVSVLAGIGFTMSLFITGLAFSDLADQETAKIGILVASLLAGVIGVILIATSKSSNTR